MHLLLLELTERAGIRAPNLLELTRRTDLRTSMAHIDLLDSTEHTILQGLTERIGLLKLKENSCFLGLTAGTGLQRLTEHKGLLKPQYTDTEEFIKRWLFRV